METENFEAIDKKFKKEIIAGITELVLLSIVNKAGGPIYGYQIARETERGNESPPIIKLGTLYPVLRSLEKSGLLDSLVEPSITGPPRRYYRISKLGLETLTRWTETWKQMKTFVDTHLAGVEQ